MTCRNSHTQLATEQVQELKHPKHHFRKLPNKQVTQWPTFVTLLSDPLFLSGGFSPKNLTFSVKQQCIKLIRSVVYSLDNIG